MGLTKKDLGILYKKDYTELEKNDYIDKIKKSAKASITYKLSFSDLQKIKEIYNRYEPKVNVDMNCNKCIMKMIYKMNTFINRYEND